MPGLWSVWGSPNERRCQDGGGPNGPEEQPVKQDAQGTRPSVDSITITKCNDDIVKATQGIQDAEYEAFFNARN